MRSVPLVPKEVPVALGSVEYADGFAAGGYVTFDPAGEEFDPECHEALSTREDGESGRVLDVVEKGYRLNGAVLRPARVVVSG